MLLSSDADFQRMSIANVEMIHSVVSFINHEHRDEQIRRELDSPCLNRSSKLGNSMQKNTAREAATTSTIVTTSTMDRHVLSY